MNIPLKLFVGLGIPYGAVIGALPWVASTDYPIFGVPFIYAWIFGCFFLTSACLYACWFFFDRAVETVDREVRSRDVEHVGHSIGYDPSDRSQSI